MRHLSNVQTLLLVVCTATHTLCFTNNVNTHTRHTHSSETTRLLEQELHTRTLGQLDTLEAIIDSTGQALSSGAVQLNAEEKQQAVVTLTALRIKIRTVKNLSTQHADLRQIALLQTLIEQASILLNGMIASGGITHPSVDMQLLEESVKTPVDLTSIQAKIIANEKSLQILMDLSEKIGLTKLNLWYRSLRTAYHKYYVWPVVERIIVYTTFVHWSIFVSSDWKLEELEDTTVFFRIFSKIAKWARGKKKELGSPAFPTEGQLKHTGYAVLPTGETVTIDGEELPQYKYAKESDLAHYEVRKDNHGRLVPFKELASLKKGQVIGEDGAEIDVFNVLKGSSSPRGTINKATDWLSAWINIDHKSPMATIPVGAFFFNYIRKDFDYISHFWNIIRAQCDDWLYGTTKKKHYESLTTPDERFSNIIGQDEVKAELKLVIEYLLSPDKFDRAGIKVNRGYILAGSPQNGKTMTAKALSGEISAAFKEAGKSDKMRLFEISLDNLIKKGIHYYMELATYKAPCILFIDEFDLLRLQRDGDSKLLAEFLTAMSGSLAKDEKSQVIIMVATNKPENLDFALRQHGRFGKLFWYDKPTFANRIEFFEKECTKRCMDPATFDAQKFAQQTEGCSFGTLDIVFKKALMLAKVEGTALTAKHFEEALDNEVKKLLPHGYTVTPEKERVIATHQAGKAVMSLLLSPQKQLTKVTVLPITQELEEEHVTQHYNFSGIAQEKKQSVVIKFGGIFAYHWSDSLDLHSQEELSKQCKILLAGNIAQKVAGLESCTFDKNDKQEAFMLAKQIVLEGLDAKTLSKDIANEKLTQAYRLLEKYEEDVTTLLTAHKSWITATTEALQKRKTLSVGEVIELRNE